MNHIVDIANTTDFGVSVQSFSGTDDAIGRIVDLANAHINTNVFVNVVGGLSGVLPIRLQTSDLTTSGSFTDPTSGLPAFPVQGRVSSGGVFWANSGLYASGNSTPYALAADAPLFCSGGTAWASFQRPHRYARAILTSGTAAIAAAIVTVGFMGQKIGGVSGGGFTLAPSSGTINV